MICHTDFKVTRSALALALTDAVYRRRISKGSSFLRAEDQAAKVYWSVFSPVISLTGVAWLPVSTRIYGVLYLLDPVHSSIVLSIVRLLLRLCPNIAEAGIYELCNGIGGIIESLSS